MKLSTRGRYGLRAMFELARHYGEGPLSIKNIARRQNISEHYLEQLIAALKKKGLVRSIRGSQGGYILSRKPGDIKVGDIIRALEGPIAPVECVRDNDSETCSRTDICVARTVWKKVKDSIIEVLDTTTLEDMCNEEEKIRKEKERFMYYI